jgi:sec-independent protein translocase protein TatA
MLLFISGAEIIIVILVVVMLFGAKKIPELAQGLGKGMKEFKKATDDIKREIKDESDIINKVKDFKDDISKKL